MTIEHILKSDKLDEVDGVTVWPLPTTRKPRDTFGPTYEIPLIPDQGTESGSVQREQLRIPVPTNYDGFNREAPEVITPEYDGNFDRYGIVDYSF